MPAQLDPDDARLPLPPLEAGFQHRPLATADEGLELKTKAELDAFLLRPGSFAALLEVGLQPFLLNRNLPDVPRSTAIVPYFVDGKPATTFTDWEIYGQVAVPAADARSMQLQPTPTPWPAMSASGWHTAVPMPASCSSSLSGGLPALPPPPVCPVPLDGETGDPDETLFEV